MGLGGSDDGEREVTEQRIVAADECEINFNAFLHRWLGKPFRDAVAIGLVGDLFAERRQVIVAVGILHVREEFAAFAC